MDRDDTRSFLVERKGVDHMINGREVTSESLRGLWEIGKEVQREASQLMREYQLDWPESKKKHIETLRNLWKEIQIVGYAASETVVREAFAA